MQAVVRSIYTPVMHDLPILYSFRRCPYAIRARMAVAAASVTVELREVVLKYKPPEMLTVSGKGTVPVLLLPDRTVVDESLDVMRWALEQSDPEGWLLNDGELDQLALIERNDGDFKHWLDKYKYCERFPEHPQSWYRSRCEDFLCSLNTVLASREYLSGKSPGFTDAAVFPFVRQFAGVDREWFDRSSYAALGTWLRELLDWQIFLAVMDKHPPWAIGQTPVVFGPGPYREMPTFS
jgi:glutathione S-transferase